MCRRWVDVAHPPREERGCTTEASREVERLSRAHCCECFVDNSRQDALIAVRMLAVAALELASDNGACVAECRQVSANRSKCLLAALDGITPLLRLV